MFAHKEYLSRFSRVSGTGNHSVGDIYVCDRRLDRLPKPVWGGGSSAACGFSGGVRPILHLQEGGGFGLVTELQFTEEPGCSRWPIRGEKKKWSTAPQLHQA